MTNAQTPDTARLSFDVSTRTVRYGNRRHFAEYRILMRADGVVVGVEDGPSQQTKTRNAALRAAQRRIEVLRSHRLYVIHVTEKHIKDGVGRDCATCPIAQALWHNQERMGFSKDEFNFEVSTYAAFMEARGIVLSSDYGNDERHIPDHALPLLVMPSERESGFATEEMMYWTMHFDDAEDAACMSIEEWREQRRYEDDEEPITVSPCSFVLDLDAMQPIREEVAA